MSTEERQNMNEITPRLYLGSATAAYDTEALKEHGITHVLTLDCNKVTYHPSDDPAVHNKYVNCLDMPSYDMLSHFDECITFIDGALENKDHKILIHCFQGMSRSCTIVIAYLMHSQKMCLEEAYGTVKEKRPIVKPNPGFLQQLELFERMGSVIDWNHPLYKKYRLEILSKRAQTGDFELTEKDFGEVDRSDTYYKCTKCRQAVFRSSSIMFHNVGEGEAAFDWRSKVPASKRATWKVNVPNVDAPCDQSLFIEPVKWMADAVKQLEGKLNCPKCNAKLGSFIWYGEKCPCGAWVAPAFHIQKSKVDLVRPRPLPNFNQSGASHVTKAEATGPISAKSCGTSPVDSQSDLNHVTGNSQSNSGHVTSDSGKEPINETTANIQISERTEPDVTNTADIVETFKAQCDVTDN